MDLERALLDERLRFYLRQKGGYTFPLAGAAYWGALSVAGAMLPLQTWILVAFFGSYVIFPLSWALSVAAGINIMERTAAGSVVGPAFVGMMIFWPMAVLAFWSAPELVAPIMAIGMAIHWPVIGWTFGRWELFSAHAVARALIVPMLWLSEPDARLVWIPASVAFLYVLTAVCIFVDLREMRASRAAE
jgi:Family of unknown function (DUF7010)